MTEIITTSDIQFLSIGLIYYHSERPRTMSDEEYERLQDILAKMNHLCTEENDYSLVMEVQEKKSSLAVNI